MAQAQPEVMHSSTVSFFSDLDGGRSRRAMNMPAFNLHAAADKAQPASTSTAASGKGDASTTVVSSSKTNQLQDSVQWLELGLCKALVRAVSKVGFLSPTPVQVAALPEALRGTDICMRAVTGSGKTAAFLLPLLNTLLTKPPKMQAIHNSKRKYIRAVVLVPSRELGIQCENMAKDLMQCTTELTISLAIGGIASKAQEAALDETPDIVIATPGRMCDILHNYVDAKGRPRINLSGVEVFVLDECDKMLTVVMKDQVEDILKRTDDTMRQTMLVSATMTKDVDDFAKEHLFKPKNVDVGHVALAAQLRQQFVRIKTHVKDVDDEDRTHAMPDAPTGGREEGRGARKRLREEESGEIVGKKGKGKKENEAEAGEEEKAETHSVIDAHISKIKTRYAVALCQNTFKNGTLIFTKFRTTAHRLTLIFNQLGMNAGELHSSQTQEERSNALNRFSCGELNYLICTDLASRGLDIRGVSTVLNFDLPPVLATYIHRVGRTARIGEKGTAVSLVHEVQDAEIMRKIITISARVNSHQIASVKRRDVSDEQIKAATEAIDAIFNNVRVILQAEALEEQINRAEKKAKSTTEKIEAIAGTVTAKPKRSWCITREERKARAEEERKQYEKEAEYTAGHLTQELNDLEAEQSRFLQRQKRQRASVREKQEKERQKGLEERKALKKKEDEKLKGGIIKKLKKAKVREARREKRAEKREKSGSKPYVSKRGERKTKQTKNRTRGRMKKH